jgi:hypothetical protein
MTKALVLLLAAASITPPIVATLPGSPVPLTELERRAGAAEVRQVALTGTGPRRVSLLVGRTRDRRLCVGSGTFFRCLEAVDAQPAYVIAAFAGTRPEPEWGALVGLAGPEVDRVTVQLQQGQRRTLALRPLAGFQWRAFVFPPIGPNGRLPYTVELAQASPGRTVLVDMADVASGCVSDPACFRPGHTWRAVGASVDAPIGETRPQMERAKRLALANPAVRKVVGPTTRLVRAPVRWTSCGGKFLGATIDVELFRATTVDGEFPFVSFGDARRGHVYAEGLQRLRADGITSLHVGVDLNRRKVVSVAPDGENVRLLGQAIVKRPTPVGAADKAACASGD